MASENVKEFNDETYAAGTSKGIVLLDFWAPWCGPCQMQGPIIDKVADAVGEKAIVAKVNVDEAKAVATNLGVQSIPTIILLKDGEEVKRMVGLQQEKDLVSAIESA